MKRTRNSARRLKLQWIRIRKTSRITFSRPATDLAWLPFIFRERELHSRVYRARKVGRGAAEASGTVFRGRRRGSGVASQFFTACTNQLTGHWMDAR